MKKIAIFAHDAGGSEILLELLKASLYVGEFRVFCTNNSPCHILIENKKLANYQEIIEPTKKFIFSKLVLFKPDIVLYSTGWQNHFEYYFLDYARKNNLPSVAFLDNWTNFRERFGYPDANWQKNFPDFIATHDKYSQESASKQGLKNPITIKNYSLEKKLNEYKKLTKKEDTLLFLSEPTAKVAKKTYGDSNYWGFNEKDTLKAILQYQKKSTCSKIVVRLHPSEESKAYKELDPNITISSNSLLKDISDAKLVIGLDTSVLHLAFLLGKKVISFMPSMKRDFHVPLPKSNQTRSLENFDIKKIKINKKQNNDLGIEFALFIKNILG